MAGCIRMGFALPKIGIRISAEACGTLGLGLLGGAYMAETFRSGLENIAPIQTESAQSLGMNPAQVFGYVVLPQAVSSSVPGLLANLIFLLKETSVFSTISLMDLVLSLAKAGSTMVIVTHEMNFARAIADRILFIENGEVVEQSDDPKAFFANPTTERAKAFLKSFDYE